MNIKVQKSKRGLPCLWESGGGLSNTGRATIICTEGGNPKKPLYVKQRGELACGEHALIPLKIGDHLIEADQHRGDFNIQLYQITSISEENAEAELRCSFSEGQWDIIPSALLGTAIDAAKSKAQDYHCRRPYFIGQGN